MKAELRNAEKSAYVARARGWTLHGHVNGRHVGCPPGTCGPDNSHYPFPVPDLFANTPEGALAREQAAEIPSCE